MTGGVPVVMYLVIGAAAQHPTPPHRLGVGARELVFGLVRRFVCVRRFLAAREMEILHALAHSMLM